MGNYDKHFWGSKEQRKKISGSREHELKTFLGTRGFINGEQGIKSKKIKGSWEHVPPPPLGGAHFSFDKLAKHFNKSPRFASLFSTDMRKAQEISP